MSAERNRRIVEEAASELADLENVVTDALARLPAVLARIQTTRRSLAGLLPRNEAQERLPGAESDDPAAGQPSG